MQFDIRRVDSANGWKDFIQVPYDLYRNDPIWVPPLRMMMKDLLNLKKNPFFKHATIHALVAYEGDKPIARIAGVIDENHNKFHKDRVGFFGFFECPNNPQLAAELLNRVKVWLKEWGMDAMRGPMNPTVNHECGLLIEGFDDSPFLMMTYNPPYYQSLLEGYGLKKTRDMFAINIHGTEQFDDRMVAQAERLRQRSDVSFRTIRMKEVYQEVQKIITIFNDAWSDNWGFVPMNDEEIKKFADELKLIVDPELILFAMVKGKEVGFGVGLPDANQVFKKIPDGRLFPFGIFKLLWFLKGPGKRSAINRCRIPILGVLKEYQPLGIGPLLYLEYYKRGPANGYPIGEASWILEDNAAMLKAAEKMKGRKSKTYRVYEQPLGSA